MALIYEHWILTITFLSIIGFWSAIIASEIAKKGK